MPELPEVESYRQVATRAVGRRIVAVDSPDAWFLKGGTTAEDLDATLVGGRFTAARRIGKLLLLDVDGDASGSGAPSKDAHPVVGIRFGMTGTLLVDGIDDASCRAAVAKLRAALQPFGAEVPATVPTVANAMPFMPLYAIRSPSGERWVPVHGMLPFSRVDAFRTELSAYYAQHESEMKRLKIRYGAMFMTVGTNAFLYEPVFYWQDDYTITQRRLMPDGYAETLPQYAANPEGRELVDRMKHGIADIFQRHGAAHLQIGKFYPYMRGRDPHTAKLLRDLKTTVENRLKVKQHSLRNRVLS